MKIIDLLKKHPKNKPITDKRILYYLKRKGYIWDYSQWGYLEGLLAYTNDKPCYTVLMRLFKEGNAKELENVAAVTVDGKKYRQTSCNIGMSYEEVLSRYISWDFEFEGLKFGTKYLDGCFSPYLITY